MEESRETKLGKIIFVYKSKNIRKYYRVIIKLKDINEYVIFTYKSPTNKSSKLNEIYKSINLETSYINHKSILCKFNKKQLLDYWDEYTLFDSYELKNIITKEERKEKINKILYEQ